MDWVSELSEDVDRHTDACGGIIDDDFSEWTRCCTNGTEDVYMGVNDFWHCQRPWCSTVLPSKDDACPYCKKIDTEEAPQGFLTWKKGKKPGGPKYDKRGLLFTRNHIEDVVTLDPIANTALVHRGYAALPETYQITPSSQWLPSGMSLQPLTGKLVDANEDNIVLQIEGKGRVQLVHPRLKAGNVTPKPTPRPKMPAPAPLGAPRYVVSSARMQDTFRKIPTFSMLLDAVRASFHVSDVRLRRDGVPFTQTEFRSSMGDGEIHLDLGDDAHVAPLDREPSPARVSPARVDREPSPARVSPARVDREPSPARESPPRASVGDVTEHFLNFDSLAEDGVALPSPADRSWMDAIDDDAPGQPSDAWAPSWVHSVSEDVERGPRPSSPPPLQLPTWSQDADPLPELDFPAELMNGLGDIPSNGDAKMKEEHLARHPELAPFRDRIRPDVARHYKLSGNDALVIFPTDWKDLSETERERLVSIYGNRKQLNALGLEASDLRFLVAGEELPRSAEDRRADEERRRLREEEMERKRQEAELQKMERGIGRRQAARQGRKKLMDLDYSDDDYEGEDYQEDDDSEDSEYEDDEEDEPRRSTPGKRGRPRTSKSKEPKPKRVPREKKVPVDKQESKLQREELERERARRLQGYPWKRTVDPARRLKLETVSGYDFTIADVPQTLRDALSDVMEKYRKPSLEDGSGVKRYKGVGVWKGGRGWQLQTFPPDFPSVKYICVVADSELGGLLMAAMLLDYERLHWVQSLHSWLLTVSEDTPHGRQVLLDWLKYVEPSIPDVLSVAKKVHGGGRKATKQRVVLPIVPTHPSLKRFRKDRVLDAEASSVAASSVAASSVTEAPMPPGAQSAADSSSDLMTQQEVLDMYHATEEEGMDKFNMLLVMGAAHEQVLRLRTVPGIDLDSLYHALQQSMTLQDFAEILRDEKVPVEELQQYLSLHMYVRAFSDSVLRSQGFYEQDEIDAARRKAGKQK